jgi:hypothetical protein
MAFHISSLKVEGTRSKTQKATLQSSATAGSLGGISHFSEPISILISTPDITVFFFGASYLHLPDNNEGASGTGKLNV